MLKLFKSVNKSTIILLVLVVVTITGSVLAYQQFFVKGSPPTPVAAEEEIELSFDPEGPYALLSPRRDGNALVLNIKRTASYDAISYEMAYNAEGIDRGVMGDIEIDNKKGEYEQEILFGSCSKNVCKYDKGVENGTLILRIKKGSKVYKMVTQWRLQNPELALGKLISGDGHFSYIVNSKESDLSLVKYSLINDLTGAPKLPKNKQVVGKVYVINTPVAKTLAKGVINIELAEAPSPEVKIARFDESNNGWVELETKINEAKLEAVTNSGGIFAVLKPQSSS